MNIFVLDADAERAALYHNDRHVCKGILECAQMLSTAHVMLDGTPAAFKRVPDILRPTHANHPCTVWARGTSGAYDWLHVLMGALLYQYEQRWGRQHAYATRTGRRPSLYSQLAARPLNVPMAPPHPFAQAMPLAYRRPDPVRAYRLYYVHEKYHLAHWSAPAEQPAWWLEVGGPQLARASA